MSLIAELQRRSVFKVGAAYLVVAWVVVQVAVNVLPQYDTPAWFLRAFILVIALGFPIALVMAWVFDMTPDGVKLDSLGTGTKRLFATAALLAALAIGWFLRGGVSDDGGDAYQAALGSQSTAVLPFVNMSPERDNEYFSDGLTETLLHKLVQVDGLKVAARTSSFAFKDKREDIRSIGRQLGVATVVEGSVQRAGDTLRITVQLVRTTDGSHIWSRNYDRKVQDLFAIQDEIAGAVTTALVGTLLPEAKAAIAQRGTQDLAAYDLYTKGLAEHAISSYASLASAEALYRQAVERDPKFTDAWVGLVRVWRDQARVGRFPNAEFVRRATPVLDRVEARQPDNAMVLGFRGIAAGVEGDDAAARAYFERAIALQPDNPELRMLNASDLWRSAAPREVVLAERQAAIRLDPLNPDYYNSLSRALLELRRFDEAAKAARRASELDPRNPNGYFRLREVAIAQGDHVGGVVGQLRSNGLDPTDQEGAAMLAALFVDLGLFDAADAWVAEVRRSAPQQLYTDYARLVLAFARDEHAQVVALGRAIAARHSEERRGNWTQAMARACLSARATGRIAEVRDTLVAARALPPKLTADAFRATASATIPLDHLLGHLVPLGPCLWAPGEAGAGTRAALFAVATELKGNAWTKQKGLEELAATLRADQPELARIMLSADAPAGAAGRSIPEYHLVAALARFRGMTGTPLVAERLDEAVRAFAAQRAALPQRLKSEGLPLLPGPATTAAAPKAP